MSVKKIGIDLDGVLCDFISTMIRIMRDQVGVKLPPDFQPSDWNWTNANLPSDAMRKAWYIIDNTPEFWLQLEPLPDMAVMANFFEQHAGADWDFFFITARKEGKGSSAKKQSEQWLRGYLREPDEEITVLPVHSGMDKVDVLHALEIHWSIDDHCPTVVNAKSGLRDHHAFLLDRPWNQDGINYGLKIVHSLKEFFYEVEKY